MAIVKKSNQTATTQRVAALARPERLAEVNGLKLKAAPRA